MKRVKEKQVGLPQSLLLAGLAMASAGAQAVTITAGNVIADRIVDAGSISIRDSGGRLELAPGGRLELRDPYAVIQPSVLLNSAAASSSVSGSMNYSAGAGSGNFSEYDSSPDGSTVELELKRKGYGYRAEASAETGLAKAHAETKWVPGSNGYGYNYGSSSANATSTWSDWFVISGGTGLGTASFASLLDGMMVSAKNGSAGYSLNIGYSTGTVCYYWYNACGEADQSQTLFSQTSSLSGKGKSTLSQDIEGEFIFAYDTAFLLTASLNVSASNGGMADFTLASLDDSLVLPEGANLLSSSGLYVQAVPEAETYAMMLAGLGLVGFAVARRRAMAK
ncbi:MAG: PEP-CTERM sorting domain-containing protein [Thiobacillus sp.]